MFLDKSNYTPLIEPITLRFPEDRKKPWLERVNAEEEPEKKPKTRPSDKRGRSATDAKKPKKKPSRTEEPNFTEDDWT